MFKSISRNQPVEAVEKIFGLVVVLICLLQVVSRTSVVHLTYLHHGTVHFITSSIAQLFWFLSQHARSQQIWEKFMYLIWTCNEITSGQNRYSLQKVLITLLAVSQWSLVWVQSSGNTVQIIQFKCVGNIKHWLKLKNSRLKNSFQ